MSHEKSSKEEIHIVEAVPSRETGLPPEKSALEARLQHKDEQISALKKELEILSAEMVKQKNELELVNSIILEGEAQIHAMVENFSGEIWSIDRDFTLLRANTRFLNSSKARNSALQIGDNILQAMSDPGESAHWKQLYSRSLSGERINLIEQRESDAGKTYFEYYLNPIQTENGNVIGVAGLNVDVTERIKSEEDRARLNKQLNEAAHRAGMADIATGVLHNIGNLLNSANTSSILILKTVRLSRLDGLRKANQLWREGLANFEEFIQQKDRISKLILYNLKLEQLLSEENQTISENATRLMDKVDAMNSIIAAQQDFARADFFVEKVALADVVEETLTLLDTTIELQNIELRKDFDHSVPVVQVQKAKLIQVLVNLYKNAIEAIKAHDTESGVVQLRILRDSDHAYIKVSDNGVGISSQNLSKVFTHGYTTKKDGHGFGLHSSANYMTEMGGRVWAESDGEGKGATIVLSFPLHAPTRKKT